MINKKNKIVCDHCKNNLYFHGDGIEIEYRLGSNEEPGYDEYIKCPHCGKVTVTIIRKKAS